MTNRFKRLKLGESIVSIVLEIHKRQDNEIPQHFIHEIKKKKLSHHQRLMYFPSN